jgi:hypothetical protein
MQIKCVSQLLMYISHTIGYQNQTHLWYVKWNMRADGHFTPNTKKINVEVSYFQIFLCNFLSFQMFTVEAQHAPLVSQ